jgi:hypothetical protein
VSNHIKILVLAAFFMPSMKAQSTSAPNLFDVLSYSSVFNQPVYNSSGNTIGHLSNAVPNVFAFGAGGLTTTTKSIKNNSLPVADFKVDTSIVQVNNAINTNIATALGVIPLASPASGVIYQTDPATGVELPASSTLGPVFTERAETIGARKLYIGVTHQDFHFTSLNGHSLNALTVLYKGGDESGILVGGTPLTSYPATFNIGMDVRLSQDIAFVTYGVTDRFDVSVGLPVVHAAVAATTYGGILYDGTGMGKQSSTNPNCWCAGSFNPGALIVGSPNSLYNFQEPIIGQSSLGKTGFGDLLVRAKGTVIHTTNLAVAIGGDLRFATGDAQNYLGTGTTSVKPFAAVSLYTPPAHGIVFAPHFNIGWQFSGKSVLGGQLQPSQQNAMLMDGSTASLVGYEGAPVTATKGYLPDVFSWAVGSEIAFGRHNTLIVDILGNEIGWVHGVPNLVYGPAPSQGFSPITLQQTTPSGFSEEGTTSYSQFNGAFGYKARLVGNLVFTFNALVRFDNNGLTARFTPLYGLGYTF